MDSWKEIIWMCSHGNKLWLYAVYEQHQPIQYFTSPHWAVVNLYQSFYEYILYMKCESKSAGGNPGYENNSVTRLTHKSEGQL